MLKTIIIICVALLLIDIIRSMVVLRRIAKRFYQENQDKVSVDRAYGQGEPFNLVIVGDSTFDVRADAKVTFGPAQVVIDDLSQHYKVYVKLLAQAGAKSYDVINKQLPELKKLSKVDLVIVYMGANNAVYFKNPWQVGRDYRKLLAYTESKGIPMIASEVANYWLFRIFSWIHQIWLYFAVHVENRDIRRAAAGCSHVTLVSIKKIHKEMHKKRRAEPYLIDGFHPDDAANIKWGTFMLGEAKHNPNTAGVFSPPLGKRS